MDDGSKGRGDDTGEEDERRRGERGEGSDDDSISHVILEAKGNRVVPPHSSSSSDTDSDPFITQLPVSRKQRPRAAHEEDVSTGDEMSAKEVASPKKLMKGQKKEPHHTSNNRSRDPKGTKFQRQPLINQYQGTAVWGLLACSKRLKQKHWSSCIQRMCSGKHEVGFSDSEEDKFLAEALVKDSNEKLREETCGEVDDDDQTDVRVVDPSSFVLKVVSGAKPAPKTKSRAKTATVSRASRATDNKKKRKSPREKRNQKT